MAFPTIFAGNIAIEEAFNLIGIRQLFSHSLRVSDYPLMIASVYVCSLVVIVFNLIIDILYVIVDSRIHYRGLELPLYIVFFINIKLIICLINKH